MSRAARDEAVVARAPLERLQAHPRNVRHDLGDLRELSASIADSGVLVPLMAERRGDTLRILHGHRRAEAARQAGLRRVPCVVVAEHEDVDAIALMVAENGPTRRGLTPAEKRAAVATMRDEFHLPYPEIAERFGVATSTVFAWRRGDGADDRGEGAGGGQGAAARFGRTKGRTVVSRGAVVALATRWDGHAPAPLIEELRGLAGSQDEREASA